MARQGLGQFTNERVRDPQVQALAAKISYAVNPDDPYPRNFTGHLKAVLKDGSVREYHQPYMRGGAHEPLPDAELAPSSWQICVSADFLIAAIAALRTRSIG